MTKIVQPTYVATQPSTGDKVNFRPFTVKEEKALLLALQEDNMETMAAAIKSLISACTDEKIDPIKVPYYDLEFLFLQIRSKSVGELIDLVGSCDCSEEAKTQFSVDISTTLLEPTPAKKTDIRIVDTPYTVSVMHPHLDDFVKLYKSGGALATEVVTNCILSIYTDEEVMDWTYQEKLDFVESMTSKQQKDLAVFLKNMPMVKIPAKYNCISCGKEHDAPLSGISNFFL